MNSLKIKIKIDIIKDKKKLKHIYDIIKKHNPETITINDYGVYVKINKISLFCIKEIEKYLNIL